MTHTQPQRRIEMSEILATLSPEQLQAITSAMIEAGLVKPVKPPKAPKAPKPKKTVVSKPVANDPPEMKLHKCLGTAEWLCYPKDGSDPVWKPVGIVWHGPDQYNPGEHRYGLAWPRKMDGKTVYMGKWWFACGNHSKIRNITLI